MQGVVGLWTLRLLRLNERMVEKHCPYDVHTKELIKVGIRVYSLVSRKDAEHLGSGQPGSVYLLADGRSESFVCF